MEIYLKNIEKLNAPWSKYYKEDDMKFSIPNISFYNYFEEKEIKFESLYSLDYFGNKIRYDELMKMIDNCAKGFYNYGVRKGDIVTICLPNMVEGIVAFFALNKIGAIADFLHPLSSEVEIKNVLNDTNSKILIMLNVNFLKWKNIEKQVNVEKVIFTDVCSYMPYVAKLIYKIDNKFKLSYKDNFKCITWDLFMINAKKFNIENYAVPCIADDDAVILHSGGTTGTPKGIVLSNKNLIAYIQSDIILSPNLYPGDTMLAIMPIFHGFGLVSNILFGLCMGMFAVIRPKFDVNDYFNMIKKYKPQTLSGVPTLYEGVFDKIAKTSIKLNCLKYVVAGGDALKSSQREKINKILKEHGSTAEVTVGYGCTEAVCAAVIESSFIKFKDDTVGIPFPGVYVGIFDENNKEVPYGEPGEICICGPTVMKGYYKNKEETDLVLREHKDGNIWLHTGDLGCMDEDGYLTYLSRIKRMIISSGYNVYPMQIEQLLEEHPSVTKCAVVGKSHRYKIEVPKAYIVLNKDVEKSDSLISEYKKICSKNLPKYAWPSEYEFVDELPVTKLGKVDFKLLQKNEKGE